MVYIVNSEKGQHHRYMWNEVQNFLINATSCLLG